MDDHIIFRPTEENDRSWMRGVMRKWWGSESEVVWKTKYKPAEKNVYIALLNGAKVGLVIFRYDAALNEIMNLTVSDTHPQVGRQLILSAVEDAKKHNSERMIVRTTNDITNTLRFYRNIGFRLQELRVDTVKESRKKKLKISMVSNCHIPIQNEIDLEMVQ